MKPFNHRYEDVARVEGLTRDEVCRKYRKKLIMIARRIHERLPSHAGITIDDLASIGAIGLLETFDRFDASRGIRFSTFVEYRIRGAMYDALRESDVFSRRRRTLAKRIEGSVQELRSSLGRQPEPQEVANYLQISLEDYHSALEHTAPITMLPLDAPADGDDGEGARHLDRLPSNEPTAEDMLVAAGLRTELKQAVQKLPEKQRLAVLMYYGKGLTLAEIAAVWKVTPSRISQILSEARATLREVLAPSIEGEEMLLSEASP